MYKSGSVSILKYRAVISGIFNGKEVKGEIRSTSANYCPGFGSCPDIGTGELRRVLVRRHQSRRLLSFFQGDPVAADSLCLEFDGRAGITVCDLSKVVGAEMWCEGHIHYCGTAPDTYSYPLSTIDTFYVPARSYIPEDVQQIELAVRIYYASTEDWRGCIPGAYVPLIGLGPGSNDCFVVDSSLITTGDTVLAVPLQWFEWPEGNQQTGVLNKVIYKRVKPGVGRIRPQLVESYNGRRTGLASHDTTGRWDMLQPVIYEEAECCEGLRGNVSNDPGDTDDISDLTMMVDYLFVDFKPLPCFDEADVNANGVIDITDLTQLVNCLFVTFAPCGEPCPAW